MPQVIIRPRSGGTGSKNAAQTSDNTVLIVITDQQIEVYTDQDAVEKLASENKE